MDRKTFEEIPFGTKVQTNFICQSKIAEKLRGQMLTIIGKDSCEIPAELQCKNEEGEVFSIPFIDVHTIPSPAVDVCIVDISKEFLRVENKDIHSFTPTETWYTTNELRWRKMKAYNQLEQKSISSFGKIKWQQIPLVE